MRILTEENRSSRKQLIAGVLVCLVSACASLPVIAAPESLDTNSAERPAGSVFEYLNIAGSTFHPHDSSTTYTYSGIGCISKRSGSSSLFAHKAILPEGAVVKFLRLYYYDTSTRNILGFFTTYDGSGTYNEQTTVSSADGPSEFGTALSPEMNFTVDRSTNAINIVANLGTQNDNTLQFCGVRVAYHAPITDQIFVNGFELIQL